MEPSSTGVTNSKTSSHSKAERVDRVTEVIPGKRYLVRMVKAGGLGRMPPWFGRWIPTLEPLHEDREIIGASLEHWHVDWRFVSERMLQDVRDYERNSRGLGSQILGLILTERYLRATEGERWKTLECLRVHELWPTTTRWMPALEFHYRNARAECGVCPHRRIRLEGSPVVEGARVCAGHGLAWDVQTGCLRARTRDGKLMIERERVLAGAFRKIPERSQAGVAGGNHE